MMLIIKNIQKQQFKMNKSNILKNICFIFVNIVNIDILLKSH